MYEIPNPHWIVAEIHCKVIYHTQYKYVSAINIYENTVKVDQRNHGYGSIMMKTLLEYAKNTFDGLERITGSLSSVDMQTVEDKSRLYHFYQNLGLLLVILKEVIGNILF